MINYIILAVGVAIIVSSSMWMAYTMGEMDAMKRHIEFLTKLNNKLKSQRKQFDEHSHSQKN